MLEAHGIRKGDVVSLLMPNSAEYIIGYFACWQLGALAGPVNSLLKEHEIEFVMNNSEAKAILVHSEFQERVANISSQLPHLQSIITFDDERKRALGTHSGVLALGSTRMKRIETRRRRAHPVMMRSSSTRPARRETERLFAHAWQRHRECATN